MKFRFGEVTQFQRAAWMFTESAFDAASVDPPIDLKAVGGQTGIESIAHVTVFRATIRIANTAELGDVEIGVAAKKWIVRPCDVIESLMPDHLPLCPLQSE